MAFIVKKNIGGREYYYLNENKRVNGKVKTKSLAYLGKDRNLAEKKAREFLEKMNNKSGEKKIKETKSVEKNFVPVETKDFLSFIQEKGFIWGPEPEIYGGLAGFYTYGPLGKLLKNKIEKYVRDAFNSNGFREIETPLVLPDIVWKASGHLDTFSDRIIKCKNCDSVFRVDKLIEEKFDISADSFSDKELLDFVFKNKIQCPSCGGDFEKKITSQNLMMKTNVAGQDASLRPETATGTYLPYPRFFNYFRKKLPFGIFQIGKAFRNEISPRQNVLRGREFTQAEGQIFIDPLEKNNWEGYELIKKNKLPFWDYKSQEKKSNVVDLGLDDALKKGFVQSRVYAWAINFCYSLYAGLGIPKERIRLRQHFPDEKAFYAEDAWDVEVNLNNYGWVEVCGIHDRTDYDLSKHSKFSGVKLEALRENGEKFIPHVVELSFGIDRPIYALLDIFYEKQDKENGKTVFKVPHHVSPIDVSIFPLMKKDELKEIALGVKDLLEKDFVVDYDESGSIGRRYLRSSSAGTPYAITIDYDSTDKKDVTVRDRDNEKQIRVKIDELKEFLKKLFSGDATIK